ncbi:MAG: NAD-dependent epimerase/dehydratase family protein [Dongiaceae bacterium]
MTRLVAVTGATGFVGGHVARAFTQAGWRVRILARRIPLSPQLADLTPDLVPGSLEDEGALRALVRRADAVVHAAGSVKALDTASFHRDNADGAARMVAAAHAASPEARFLLISSLSAREPGLSAYAASKRAGERVLETGGTDLDWAILRPPVVYGPGDREMLPFFRMAANGMLAAPDNGPARLSLIHAADLARACVAIVDSREAHQATIEIDDRHPGGYGWPEIATALAGAVGREVRLRRLPRWLFDAIAGASAGWAGITKRPAMVTPGKVRELFHPDWVSRMTGFQQILDWQPQFTVNKGFSETAAAYRTLGLLR